MAKATVTTKTRTEITSVTLTLTPYEARVLRYIVGNIGGSDKSRDNCIDPVFTALNSAGIDSEQNVHFTRNVDLVG